MPPDTGPEGARGLEIRPALLEELAALHELDEAVYAEKAYGYVELRQMFDIHRSSFLIAEDAVGPRGYALAVPADEGGHGWILGLVVHPDFRGRGCGRLLTQRALQLLAERGVVEARLTVEPANTIAIALYQQFGFRIVADDPDYFGPGERRFVMAAKVMPAG